jgi:hypothetical protein
MYGLLVPCAAFHAFLGEGRTETDSTASGWVPHGEFSVLLFFCFVFLCVLIISFRSNKTTDY